MAGTRNDTTAKTVKHERRQQPNPAWAWEYLRRNRAYIRDYRAAAPGRQSPKQITTGSALIRETRCWPEAEKWGLLTFCDPQKHALHADVFWRPDHLAGALRINMTPIATDDDGPADGEDEIILSAIKTRRTILDTVNGVRHLLLSSERFWIQLYCETPVTMTDHARIGVRIDGMKHYRRRLDTADQLLSLYQSSGRKLSLIGRSRNSKRLADGLVAFDIIAAGGSHRDVAIALQGKEDAAEKWGQPGAYLEDWTRRLIHRATHLVDGGYMEFLTKKSV